MKAVENGLYRLEKKDVEKAGRVLLDAFQDDPVWNAVFTGETGGRQILTAFYETPLRYCLQHGSVYASSENLEGVAAWVPGERSEMTFWRMLGSGALKSGMKMGMKAAKRMQTVFKPVEQDRKQYMKEAGTAFLYLQIIGVAASFQGKGFGRKLLNAVIAESERTGKPIYLETETEQNVEMYKKYGFRLIQRITLPEINLPMWEMVREM